MHFALLTWPNTGPDHVAVTAAVNAAFTPAPPPTARWRLLAPAWTRLTALLAALAGAALPGSSQAAGGHHAVDDATTLDAGQCQVELWSEHQPGDQLQHFGPACHVQGVEVGFHLDRNVVAHHSAPGTAGLQLKWARELQPGLALGALWAADWQNGQARSASQTLLLPVTWQPHERLALHLNIGREFRPQAADLTRQGLALEWQAAPAWQLLVEGWRDATPLHRRVGLRYTAAEGVTLDLSRATAREAAQPARWTLGLNWVFDR